MPPILVSSRSWWLLYPLLDGNIRICKIRNAKIVFGQWMKLAWLSANRNTGIRKNENGIRRCFTVFLSNQDKTGGLYATFIGTWIMFFKHHISVLMWQNCNLKCIQKVSSFWMEISLQLLMCKLIFLDLSSRRF